jgi:hypothetical protein
MDFGEISPLSVNLVAQKLENFDFLMVLEQIDASLNGWNRQNPLSGSFWARLMGSLSRLMAKFHEIS